MVARHEGNASNAQRQLSNTLSDGLEPQIKAEGANVAPERTDVREDQERMASPAGFEPATPGLGTNIVGLLEVTARSPNFS